MNYCQFRNELIKRMCNSVKPLLPAEYQQVDYLQSSGAQYIKTGINSGIPTNFYVKYEATAINSNNYIFGTWDSVGRYFVSYNSSGLQWLGYRDSAYSGGTMALNSVCELTGTLKPGTQNLYKDGVLQSSGTNSGAITAQMEIVVFAVNYGPLGKPPIQAYTSGKMYRFTLYNNLATILDYIPCYRKSDNKPGMYDLVTNTFFTNAGTGADFSVGNNV